MRLDFSPHSLSVLLGIKLDTYSQFIEALYEGPIVPYKLAQELLGEKFHEQVKLLQAQLSGTGYIITDDNKEQYYYLEYRSSLNKFGNPVKKKIGALKAMVEKLLLDYSDVLGDKQDSFREIDFRELKIGETSFRDHEFVQEVLRRVGDVFGTEFELREISSQSDENIDSSDTAFADKDDEFETHNNEGTEGSEENESQKADETDSIKDEEESLGLRIPEGFSELKPGGEKLRELYRANIGSVLTPEQISKLVGIDVKKINSTNGNLKTRFDIGEGMVIKSIGRTYPGFVYCNEKEFEDIKEAFIASQNSENLGLGGNDTDVGYKNDGESSDKKEDNPDVESFLSLFREDTATYEIYEVYFNAYPNALKANDAKASCIRVGNIGNTITAVNKVLESNGTGQQILSVEGWGMYKLMQGEVRDASQDFIDKEDVKGSTFRISYARAFGIAQENKKWINLKKKNIKGKKLTDDEFIFCLLCAENNEVGIHEEEIRKNLLDETSLTWNDIIVLKNTIAVKLGEAKLEFIIPERGSILLREKNLTNTVQKFFDFMKSKRGQIVSVEAIKEHFNGEIGTDEKLKLVFNLAKQKIPDNANIRLHRLGARNDWIEFFFGTHDELTKAKENAKETKKEETNGDDEEKKCEKGDINELGFEYRGYFFSEGKALKKIYDALFLSETGRIKSKKDISKLVAKINDVFIKRKVGQRIDVFGNPEENRFQLVKVEISEEIEQENTLEIEDSSNLFSQTSPEFIWYLYLLRNKGMPTSILPINSPISRPLSSFIEKINDILKNNGKNQRVRIIKKREAILEYHEYQSKTKSSGGGFTSLADLGLGGGNDEGVDAVDTSKDTQESGGNGKKQDIPEEIPEQISQEEIVFFDSHILDLGHDFLPDIESKEFGVSFSGNIITFYDDSILRLSDIEFIFYTYLLSHDGNPQSLQQIMSDICLFDEEIDIERFKAYMLYMLEEILQKMKDANIPKDMYIKDVKDTLYIEPPYIRVDKGGRVFLWNQRTRVISYGEEKITLNSLEPEIQGYIERLLDPRKGETFNIGFKKRNPENEKHRIDAYLKEKNLPFQCGSVNKGQLPFQVKPLK